MKRLAIPYIRFSTKEQMSGSSLDRQRALVDKWLQEHRDEFTESTDSYEDRGLSGRGAHIEKGRLGALLQAIENGMIPSGSVILIEAVDRLTRLEPLDALEPVRTIIKAGITLIDLETNTSYDSEALRGDALLMFLFKARGAYEYSQRLSGRIVDSYKDRVKKAKTGESIKRRNGFWLTNDGKLIPEAAAVVREVFQRYVDGTTIRSIARDYPDYLKNTASVRHLLRNPAVIGHWQRYKLWKKDGKQKRDKDELIENVFEPAIDDALFYQAQALQDKEKTGPLTVARVMPLAGLVVCAECGGNFVLLKAGNNSATDTMRCYHRIFNKASCSNGKTMPMPVLRFVFNQSAQVHMKAAYQRTRLPELQKQRVTLQGKLSTIKTALRGIEKLSELNPDDDELLTRYSEKIAERKQVESELDALPASVDDVSFDPMDFARFLRNDIFALCKTLQIDGYRIRCGRNGEVVAGVGDATSFSGRYTGYTRKAKTWEFDVDGKGPISLGQSGPFTVTGTTKRIAAPTPDVTEE